MDDSGSITISFLLRNLNIGVQKDLNKNILKTLFFFALLGPPFQLLKGAG